MDRKRDKERHYKKGYVYHCMQPLINFQRHPCLFSSNDLQRICPSYLFLGNPYFLLFLSVVKKILWFTANHLEKTPFSSYLYIFLLSLNWEFRRKWFEDSGMITFSDYQDIPKYFPYVKKPEPLRGLGESAEGPFSWKIW